MLVPHGVKSFIIKVQKGIFPVGFVILVPRENDQIFTQKSNIFYLMALNWSQVSAYTPPKPFLDVTYTLGDSNIQGYRPRRLTSRDKIENVIRIGHSEKKYENGQKKKPIRFQSSKSKFWLIQKLPMDVGNILYESECWFRALKTNEVFFWQFSLFRKKVENGSKVVQRTENIVPYHLITLPHYTDDM